MKIEHCLFPDDLLYDATAQTWVRPAQDWLETGVTSLLATLAGKLISVTVRPAGTRVAAGRSLGTLEGPHYVGPIPAPVSGTILESNRLAPVRPKVVNDDPYAAGWIARLRPENWVRDRAGLRRIQDSSEAVQATIREYRIRCFRVMPDHDMVEVGVECAAVLKHLDELLETRRVGVAVHLVVDDPTAYVEIVRWTDQTHHALVDGRREGDLYHFIVQKTH